MQDWMRKHRRLIMFFILVFIGIPFVFMFGVPSRPDNAPVQEDSAIAQVGGIPLRESEFRRNLESAAAMRRGQDGETPSYRELDADGTVQRIIENMVDTALMRLQEQQRSFTVDTELISNQMQQWDMFRDENGRFNHQAWNEWVGSVTRWDEIYDEMRSAVARQVYLSTITAPAGRLLEEEIAEQLLANHTKLRAKYAKIEPSVVPSDEEILAHFENNPETYRLPEQYRAEYLAISLAPDMPELALELVERARLGEDFAELATTYSSLSMPEGGEMGWRTEDEFMAPHLIPLFDLIPGEVSDPVVGPTGYFIYKNEEERINEETGEREIFARQIVLNVELDPLEVEAREQQAAQIAERLENGIGPADVAEELGLELVITGLFDRSSTEIENVPINDVFQFRSQVIAQKDTPWKPIKARNNIFLSRVAETQEGAIPAFEDVLELARDNVVTERKRTEEYREEVQRYSERVKEAVSSIADIAEQFPELEVTTGEITEPFSRTETLFQYQVYVQTSLIHDAMKDAEPGELIGPLSGFFGDAWFFELVERVQPSAEELAAMEEEREEIRERMRQTAQYELLADYTKDLRERMLASVTFQQNTAALNRILGRDLPEDIEPVDVDAPPVSDEDPAASTDADSGSDSETPTEDAASEPEEAVNTEEHDETSDEPLGEQ